jgi:hypothetical protein
MLSALTCDVRQVSDDYFELLVISSAAVMALLMTFSVNADERTFSLSETSHTSVLGGLSSVAG